MQGELARRLFDETKISRCCLLGLTLTAEKVAPILLNRTVRDHRPDQQGGMGDRSEPGCSNPRGGECREGSSTTGCCGTPYAGAATEACEDKSQPRERHASWQSNAVTQLPGSRPWRRWAGPTGPRSWHGAPNPVEPACQWRLSLTGLILLQKRSRQEFLISTASLFSLLVLSDST